jgi:ribosomal protein S18 acetylase RimI-like enzyme
VLDDPAEGSRARCRGTELDHGLDRPPCPSDRRGLPPGDAPRGAVRATRRAGPPASLVREEPRLSALVDAFGTVEGDAGSIAEQDGEPVGAAWVRLVSDGYAFVDDDVPELSVAIRPERRGQGIGGSLLATLLASIERIVPGVSLSCDERNPARHLYERFGFEQVRFEQPHSIVMLRRFEHDDLVPMAPLMAP